MKTLLVALNSKFIHSNLALRYIKAYCDGYHDMELMEFSINDRIERIVGQIFLAEPDLVAFSCYIWNIKEVLMAADTIKRVLKHCKVVLGGPEVSFDAAEIIEDNPGIDFIVMGEGERTFAHLLDTLQKGGDLSRVKGLAYRQGNETIVNPPQPLISDLDSIPFPYQDGFSDLENKIVYYETSRGCPFNCQYCLSSTFSGVRFFPLDRVKRELEIFVKAGIPQVKLVDRTFNCNPERAKDIFKTILELGGKTNFHFEMAGNLIDQEMIDILKQAPPGLFQFEIGVQSTNPDTLDAIRRKTDFDALAGAVARIRDGENIHVHLDLIAGLPNEDYRSFRRSFNDVYYLAPNRLQLGFLKLLKGSGLRIRADEYGYEYTQYPPYQVLKSQHISYEELLKLETIEDLVEKYYNSRGFQHTLDYIINSHFKNPFDFFENFAEYWEKNGHDSLSYSRIRLYEILLEYGLKLRDIDHRLFKNIMRFDWVSQSKPSRYPAGLEPVKIPGMGKAIDLFFKDEDNLRKFLPHLRSYTPRQISRRAHIEMFDYDIVEGISTGRYSPKTTFVLFDYMIENKIFRKSRYYNIMVEWS
ncbi:MAG: B12-binding domain-containing radical SAM protein [Clostridiales bacterium]|nr:B12-binding domain-containing radical SAM protein [Clostridiales bacterium]